jgi:hypothetical protein
MKKRPKLLTGFAVILLVISALVWFSYVAQSIGYSDMPPSVRQQNYSLKVHASLAFWIAVGLEGFGVSIVSWQRVLNGNGAWLRLGAAFGIALTADFFTYAFIHGF